MAATKRYGWFTLRRSPFWLFFLAGISILTLAPLFVDPLTVTATNCLAAAIIITTLAARFRDIGCSAWLTPLAAIPMIALFAGVTASDDQKEHPGAIEYRLLGTSLMSFLLITSWAAYMVVKI